MPSPGRTVSIDELRGENVIVMQEGAGVRQIVEDELRGLGLRLRDLDVGLELGLQESVRSAVQAGYGVAFISRSAVESELAAGTLTSAKVEGLDAKREISLVRAAGRTATRAADAFVEFARAELAEMIVRWGLAELAELAGDRPFVVASPRWRHVLDAADRWEEVPSHRIEVPDGVDTIVAVGGGSAIDTAQGGVRGNRLAARLGPDDVLRRRVDDVLRRPRSRPADARRRRRGTAARDRLRAGAHARPAARGDRRHRAERARALRPRRSTWRDTTPRPMPKRWRERG